MATEADDRDLNDSGDEACAPIPGESEADKRRRRQDRHRTLERKRREKTQGLLNQIQQEIERQTGSKQHGASTFTLNKALSHVVSHVKKLSETQKRPEADKTNNQIECKPGVDPEDESELLRGAILACSTPILFICMDGAIIESNFAFQEMMGYDPNELNGQTIYMHAVPEDMAGLMSAVCDLITHKSTSEKREVRLIHKQGHTIHSSLLMNSGQNGEKVFITAYITALDTPQFRGSFSNLSLAHQPPQGRPQLQNGRRTSLENQGSPAVASPHTEVYSDSSSPAPQSFYVQPRQSPHQQSPQPSTPQTPMQPMPQSMPQGNLPQHQPAQVNQQQDMYRQQGQGYQQTGMYPHGSTQNQQMMFGQPNGGSQYQMPMNAHQPQNQIQPQMRQGMEYRMPANNEYGYQDNTLSTPQPLGSSVTDHQGPLDGGLPPFPPPPGMGDMQAPQPLGTIGPQGSGIPDELLWLNSAEDIDAVLKDDLTGPSADFQAYNSNGGFW